MEHATAHFGQYLAARIEAQGLSLRDAAEATGIPLATLHRRLRSSSSSFTLAELNRVAETLGTSASVLLASYEAAA